MTDCHVSKTAASAAATVYGVSVAEIFHPTRKSEVATRARHLAWTMCHDNGMTLADIGRRFGRDYNTVRHGVKAARARWRNLFPCPAQIKAKRNQEILRRKSCGQSHRQIAREMGIGLGVVAGVVTRNKKES